MLVSIRCVLDMVALYNSLQVETSKKFGAGANKVTGVGKDAAKLDRETEELHHER